MNYENPYSFYGQIREAILCRDKEVIIEGPADTGKTLGLLWKLHTLAYKYPGCQLAIIRKRKTDITGTSYHTLKRDLLTDYGPGVTVYGGQYPQWIDYPTGSRIWFGGMDDPGKTLSAERDLIYVNQAEELALSDWEYLIRCVTGRGAVMPYTQLLGDCNPASPTHWILSRAKSGTLRLFNSKHHDNPMLYDQETGELAEGGKERLDALKRLTGSRLLRLYHGLWAAPEGAIYDVFDQEKHVVKAFTVPPFWPRAVGIDPFGATVAAVWLAFDPRNNKLNVYREYAEPFGLTTTGHAVNILELSKGESVFAWVCGGPSERAWRLEWQASGIPVLEPPVSDVWIGIDRVYQLLREFSLVIHDNCIGLISEIGNYRRKLDRQGQPTDSIEAKESYHLLDALRYIIVWLSHFEATQERVSFSPYRLGRM